MATRPAPTSSDEISTKLGALERTAQHTRYSYNTPHPADLRIYAAALQFNSITRQEIARASGDDALYLEYTNNECKS